MKNKWIIATGLIVSLMAVSYYVLGLKIEAHEQTTANGSKPYMIILGAKVKPNGDPSLALQARLDTALQYLQAHPHVQVIVSGGKGDDEPQSEASTMLAFLKMNGIERHRIIVEDKSTSTYENILYAKQLLPADVSHITIVSNDFHLARATHIAHALGLQADTIAAPTPKAVETQLRIRERVALCKTLLFDL